MKTTQKESTSFLNKTWNTNYSVGIRLPGQVVDRFGHGKIKAIGQNCDGLCLDFFNKFMMVMNFIFDKFQKIHYLLALFSHRIEKYGRSFKLYLTYYLSCPFTGPA